MPTPPAFLAGSQSLAGAGWLLRGQLGRLGQAGQAAAGQQPGWGNTISPGIQAGPVSPEAVYHRGLISPMAHICLLSWAVSSACHKLHRDFKTPCLLADGAGHCPRHGQEDLVPLKPLPPSRLDTPAPPLQNTCTWYSLPVPSSCWEVGGGGETWAAAT